MNKTFSDEAFAEYKDWVVKDKRIWNKINDLFKDIERNGEDKGIGNPEPLRHGYSGYWSRRINGGNRLIYRCEGDVIYIVKCKGHYE